MRDVNMEVAGELNDMALIHASRHGRFAYKKASRSILQLDQPLDEFVEAHSPREIPYIGPATERVILEHLRHGRSETVERAVDKSGRRDEIAAARKMRTHFLSRAGVLAVLSTKKKGA